MKVKTQDGLTVIPCEAVRGQYNDRYHAWDIICISPISGQDTKRLGTYYGEDQFKNIFSELQAWLDDRSRRFKTYYMPPDTQAITETAISFSDVTLGIK